MPELTRRREKGPHQESWHVYYGDVQVGWIGERAGVPKDVEQWGWACGFYPGSRPGECTAGAATSFEEARAGFERDWQAFLAKRTEDDFAEYRYWRAFQAWKYAMWDAGRKMPTQTVDGWTKCFCGAPIDNKSSHDHIIRCHLAVA
jgi:hypothetical protein